MQEDLAVHDAPGRPQQACAHDDRSLRLGGGRRRQLEQLTDPPIRQQIAPFTGELPPTMRPCRNGVGIEPQATDVPMSR